MAYMNQEMKKLLMPNIKKVLNRHGVKVTFSVRHHSALVANIKSSHIDFGTDGYDQVNEYYIEDHYQGEAAQFLIELKEAMNGCDQIQNFDKSDIQTDYFHVGWYIDIEIGSYKKPYELLRKVA